MNFNIFITKRIYPYFLLFFLASISFSVSAMEIEQNQKDFLSNLMPELRIMILRNVVKDQKIEDSKRDISNLRLVNKRFREVIDKPAVFKTIVTAMSDSKKNVDITTVIPDTTGWNVTHALRAVEIANHWKKMPAFKNPIIQAWLKIEKKQIALVRKFQSAAKDGDMEVLNNLLPQIENTVGINATNALGNTTLFLAAIYNKLEVIPWLVLHGADCNKPNKYNDTPLDYFVSQGKHDIVSILLKHANPNTFGRCARPPLSTAIIYNNLEMVNLLIAARANPDIKSDMDTTPLMQAVDQDNFDIVKILVENGASISIKNNQNETALDMAKGYTTRAINKEIVDVITNHFNSVPIPK